MGFRPIRSRLRPAAAAIGLLATGLGIGGVSTPAADAAIATGAISAPDGSVGFGERLTVLPNGNFVVADPSYSTLDLQHIGAVFLYDGRTNQVVSTLTGSHAGDEVGSNGVVVVGASNVVVLSPSWSPSAVVIDPSFALPFGSGPGLGAVTWVDGTSGLNGVVGPDNSLVGASAGDAIGANGVIVLDNGNFVVGSYSWDNGPAVDAGAATWGNGASGTHGVVGPDNSIVGSSTNDFVAGVRPLTGGNYVVTAPNWDDGSVVDAGAAAWGNGATGSHGVVSSATSLVGSVKFDYVGSNVEPLTNGNYVVTSPNWNNGAVQDAGAATWGDGTTGVHGTIDAANSLVGRVDSDRVGGFGVAALTNGNYVVSSPFVDDGVSSDVGMVTWGSGTAGVHGEVGPTNSLSGGSDGDQVGFGGVTALTNGNYVVSSRYWDDGPTLDAGAATWVDGTVARTGIVAAAGSFVGAQASDEVGAAGALALTNGNYVVLSPNWSNGAITQAGAATWGNGSGGSHGVVAAANSLVGSGANDHVGDYGSASLTNGNYVVPVPGWDDGATPDVGAAAWGNGATGTAGVIGAGTALVGSTADDAVGAQITPLANGNYVVASPRWDDGTVVDAGAVTWGDGSSGARGVVSAGNSLVGSTDSDLVGDGGVVRLPNGNYVVASPAWSAGSVARAGAVTFGSGTTGVHGAVGAANSLVGSTADDQVGNEGVWQLAGGGYVVASSRWDHGSVVDAGAATLGRAGGTVGPISTDNSVIGTPPGQVLGYSSRLVVQPFRVCGGCRGPVGERWPLTSAGWIAVPTTQHHVLLLDGGSDYVPLTPARLADTRPGGQTVDTQVAAGGVRAAGSTLELPVAGRGGALATSTAVTLNVTAVDPAGPGFVTVYPCGTPRPNASNLNFTQGAVVPNAVVSKLGADGKVCVFVSNATHLVVDVDGYFPAGSSLQSLQPARLLDTRPGHVTVDGVAQAAGAGAARSVTSLVVAGRATVPADATAVVLNVTVTEAAAAGYLTVYPCGGAVPTASSVNFDKGATVANLVVTKLGAGGAVCLFTTAGAHLVVDITGWFPAVTGYASMAPARLMDTRAGEPTVDGADGGAGSRPAGTTTELVVAGRAGVPAGVATAVLNVTVTGTPSSGYLTVYPCGVDRPLASNLNFSTWPGATVANAVITKVGDGGKVCLYNSNPTHLVVDVSGYFLD